jgi:hypothetical protein
MPVQRNVRSFAKAAPAAAPQPKPAPADDGALEVTFDSLPTEAPVKTAVIAAPTTAIVEVAPRREAIAFEADSGIQGDWDSGDIKLPALRIVQGSGELSQRFTVGTVILGEEQVLPSPDLRNPRPDDIFRFVPVSITKQFKENLSQEEMQGGAMARYVSSIEEVEALGGTTQWIGNQRPTWSPSARVVMLVERPESGPGSEHPGFVIELGGRLYAPAIYYAAGTSYAATAKLIFNAALTVLTVPVKDEAGNVVKGPNGVVKRAPLLAKNFWSWRTGRKAAGDFTVWCPEVRLLRDETSDDIREQVRALRS